MIIFLLVMILLLLSFAYPDAANALFLIMATIAVAAVSLIAFMAVLSYIFN